jgi:FkbM family methyltransferase
MRHGDAQAAGRAAGDADPANAALRHLLDTLGTERLTRIVDVGANPLSPPPYQPLLDMGGCDVIGFEPHPDAFAELMATRSERETYLPAAVGDGSTETLRIYRESGLTSIFPPYEGAIRFLGRSRRNIELVEAVSLETRALDDVEEIGDFDLLKIDIQGGEVKVFRGAERSLSQAVAVIPEVRFYQLYEGEPMFGGIDLELRRQGFQLHKIVEPKAKVIPNSQIDRLRRTAHRNQVIDADAVYLRDLGQPDGLATEKIRHLAILAAGVIGSFDLAVFCLDLLVARGALDAGAPGRFVDLLPPEILKP